MQEAPNPGFRLDGGRKNHEAKNCKSKGKKQRVFLRTVREEVDDSDFEDYLDAVTAPSSFCYRKSKARSRKKVGNSNNNSKTQDLTDVDDSDVSGGSSGVSATLHKLTSPSFELMTPSSNSNSSRNRSKTSSVTLLSSYHGLNSNDVEQPEGSEGGPLSHVEFESVSRDNSPNDVSASGFGGIDAEGVLAFKLMSMGEEPSQSASPDQVFEYESSVKDSKNDSEGKSASKLHSGFENDFKESSTTMGLEGYRQILDKSKAREEAEAKEVDQLFQDQDLFSPGDSGKEHRTAGSLRRSSNAIHRSDLDAFRMSTAGHQKVSQLQHLLLRSVYHFYSSRGDRRCYPEETYKLGSKKSDASFAEDGSNVCVIRHVHKEPIVLGCLDTTNPLRCSKEFLLWLRESLLEQFLSEMSTFRAIASRSRCEIEITRRIVNRKVCVRGGWLKYLVIKILGSSDKSVEICDLMLRKTFPVFRTRIVYPRPAHCTLFITEDMPDNAKLYKNYQRTGEATDRYGFLDLTPPHRRLGNTHQEQMPWRVGRNIGERFAFTSGSSFAYPNYGNFQSAALPNDIFGSKVDAEVRRLQQATITRRMDTIQQHKLMSIPICR